MSKPKYTPGPWIINGDEIHDRKMRRDEHGAWIGGRPNRIATIDYMIPEETADANAALIAAAPEMLEVLKWCVETFDGLAAVYPSLDNERGFARAKAVIKKAKGENV